MCKRMLQSVPGDITESFSPMWSLLTQEIEGFTWPGIEYGAPPSSKFSFYEVQPPPDFTTRQPSAQSLCSRRQCLSLHEVLVAERAQRMNLC